MTNCTDLTSLKWKKKMRSKLSYYLNLVAFFISLSLITTAHSQLVPTEFLEMADGSIPGLTSYYIDENQVVFVLIKEASSSSSLQAMSATQRTAWVRDRLVASVGEALSDTLELPLEQLQNVQVSIVESKYDARELSAWANLTQNSLSQLSGVTSLGFNITTGKLLVGISPDTYDATLAQLNSFLKSNGIPADAIKIEVGSVRFSSGGGTTPPPLKNANYTQRPLILALAIDVNSPSAGRTKVCSIGFFARKGSSYGFVTAYHCAVNANSTQEVHQSTYLTNKSQKVGSSGSGIGGDASAISQIDAMFVKLDPGIGFLRNEFPNVSSTGEYTTTSSVRGKKLSLLSNTMTVISRRQGQYSGRVYTTRVFPNHPFLFQGLAKNLYCFPKTNGTLNGESGTLVINTTSGVNSIAGILTGTFDVAGTTLDDACFTNAVDIETALGVQVEF
jgi:hypothetical protein